VGLVLPAALDIAPVLVPLAALGLVMIMVGAVITRIRRHEAKFMVGDPVYLALTGVPSLYSTRRAAPQPSFLARAKAWFAANGIAHIHRVVTDNGACYRSRHNGKVERYQRTLAEEVLYARPYDSEDERSAAIGVWNIHYNFQRAIGSVRASPHQRGREEQHRDDQRLDN
jgi:hypothetical protein